MPPVGGEQFRGDGGGGNGPGGAGGDDDYEEEDRRRLLWIIGGLVLVAGLLIGGLVAVLASGDDDEPSATTTSSTSTSTSTTTTAPPPPSTSPPTQAPNPPPPAVTGVEAGPGGGSGEVQVTWDSSAAGDVTSYNIYRAAAPGGPFGYLATVNALEYVDTPGFDPAYYRVTAVDSGGQEGPPSAVACGTPVGGDPC
jgi:hypothetical protein